ncbi:MAG: NAD(P)H-hydrate dehydratase [Yoonia sp.]|uniref:NAD(P)H-hydrate dehydratase n=1 Tax=Yoonia sp. TaxID=2212373 RepID=UPI003EF42C8B
MTELLTAAQLRAIEHSAMTSGEVTGLELMERAGTNVVQEIYKAWPELAPAARKAPLLLLPGAPMEAPAAHEGEARDEPNGPRGAMVLCGPGNNGGDGFVIARLLQEAGWQVEVYLYGDADKLPPDAAANHARWNAMGETKPLDAAQPPEIAGNHLVIDALFGTGLTRPIADLGALLRNICGCVDAGRGLPLADRFRHWPLVVAVDIPSGVCADSGKILALDDFSTHGGSRAACAVADLTVTFHACKQGHVLADGPRCCGRVVRTDIGLPHATARDATWVKHVSETAARYALHRPQGHKYSHGHGLVLSGGVGKGGAARLAARGALRVGAGAVTLGCPPAALIENAAQLNATMLRGIKDAEGLSATLEDDRINTLCLGPGLGVGDDSRALIKAALMSGRKAVLDADALTVIGRDAPLFSLLHDKCVLTPHAGEFARLFPDLAKKLDARATQGPAYSKVDATRAAAARAGCVVLFKGPDTVIADPEGRCRINAAVYERATPWLATAGSGDVLAGFITGLLARGFAPLRAAEQGAWLHTACALSFGPGLIAEDLPEELPKVFRTLAL